MNLGLEERKKLFERRDYVVIAIPWLAALAYWGTLKGLRHLEDIWQAFGVLGLGILAALVALGIDLYGAKGRRLRLVLAWLVSMFGAWLSLMTVFGGP